MTEEPSTTESNTTKMEPDKSILDDMAKLEGTYKENREDSEFEPRSNGELLMLVGTTFAIAAGFLGDHWHLNEGEGEAFTAALDPVLDKYCPDLSLGVEITLVMAAGMIVLPRVMQTKAINEKAKKDHGDKSEKSPEPACPVSGVYGVREVRSVEGEPDTQDQA